MILVPYEPHHWGMLKDNLREYDVESLNCLGNYEHRLSVIGSYGPAYTGVHNGKVVGIGGIMLFWRGVGEAWLVGSKQISSIKMDFHKTIIRVIDTVSKGLNIVRLQGVIPVRHSRFIRWMEISGFEYESTMEKYGANGEDCVMMKRIMKCQ
jgi:hypothetical protein